MGLLESILKRQVRRMVNSAIDEAVDNTVGAALRDAFGQNGKEFVFNNFEQTHFFEELLEDRKILLKM